MLQIKNRFENDNDVSLNEICKIDCFKDYKSTIYNHYSGKRKAKNPATKTVRRIERFEQTYECRETTKGFRYFLRSSFPTKS